MYCALGPRTRTETRAKGPGTVGPGPVCTVLRTYGTAYANEMKICEGIVLVYEYMLQIFGNANQ